MGYVIIDLVSRFVVGWMVATKECKHLAAQLFTETIARHGVSSPASRSAPTAAPR